MRTSEERYASCVWRPSLNSGSTLIWPRTPCRAVIELEGGTFDGIPHVDDRVPQRLVTATGPNPLPR
jgi:hypothetical protein